MTRGCPDVGGGVVSYLDTRRAPLEGAGVGGGRRKYGARLRERAPSPTYSCS